MRQMTEFWIEMVVQLCKSCVRYRTTKHPEKVAAMDFNEDDALALAPLLHPDADLKDYYGFINSRAPDRFRGALIAGAGEAEAPGGCKLDDSDDAGNMLLGIGVPMHTCTGDVQERARGALRQYAREMTPLGWSAAAMGEAAMHVYARADLETYETLYARNYKRCAAALTRARMDQPCTQTCMHVCTRAHVVSKPSYAISLAFFNPPPSPPYPPIAPPTHARTHSPNPPTPRRPTPACYRERRTSRVWLTWRRRATTLRQSTLRTSSSSCDAR